MKKEEIISSAKKFARSIKKTDKVAVLHHTDADGICSGILAAKAVERRRGKKPDLVFCQRDGETSVTDETASMLKLRGIEKIIITDLAVDETPSGIKELEGFCKILVIDHHLKVHELNSKNTLLVKAEDISDIEPARYPASKIVYDLFFELLGKKEAWIAAIGLVGDYGESVWKEFLLELENEGTHLTDIRAAEELIGYARAANQEKGVNEAYNIIYAARNVKDVLESPLAKYRGAVEEELEKHIKEHKKTALFAGDVVIYDAESKYNVKSRLANRLSHELYPDRTVIVLQIGKRRTDISARRQDMKKSMAELVKKAVAGIPDSLGGGHVPAAGGYFPVQYLDEVKKRLIASASQS